VVKPDKRAALDRIAKKLIAGKPRYQAVADKTGVPWAAIALIHQMECGGDWSLNIAQGDPWNRRSVHAEGPRAVPLVGGRCGRCARHRRHRPGDRLGHRTALLRA